MTIDKAYSGRGADNSKRKVLKEHDSLKDCGQLFMETGTLNKNIILINKRMGRCGWENQGTHPNRVDIFRWLSRKGVQVAPLVLTCFCSETLSLLTEDTDDP